MLAGSHTRTRTPQHISEFILENSTTPDILGESLPLKYIRESSNVYVMARRLICFSFLALENVANVSLPLNTTTRRTMIHQILKYNRFIHIYIPSTMFSQKVVMSACRLCGNIYHKQLFQVLTLVYVCPSSARVSPGEGD